MTGQCVQLWWAESAVPSYASTGAPWLPSGQNDVGRKLSLRPPTTVATRATVTIAMSTATAATNLGVIKHQLERGTIGVNVAGLSREDATAFADQLMVSARNVRALRLVCLPRPGSGLKLGAATAGAQYEYSAMQDGRARSRFILHSAWHKDAVKYASATVQHKQVRFRLHSALLDVLLQSDIEELEIGMRLSPSGYKVLSEGLARNTTLKRLSLSGSHLGDANLMLLQQGLESNRSLEELDLTACGLSDDGAACVASVVKRQADRRITMAFHHHLREYPDSSRGAAAAQAAHQAALRAAAKEVDEACGGLMHIAMAENEVTDRGASELCRALSFDRRLVLLSLRANALTPAAEVEFVELMRDHRALARVDMRQNLAPAMGILKLRKPARRTHFMPGLGFTLHDGVTAPASPAVTQTSRLLWELMDSATATAAAGAEAPAAMTQSPRSIIRSRPGDDGDEEVRQENHTASSFYSKSAPSSIFSKPSGRGATGDDGGSGRSVGSAGSGDGAQDETTKYAASALSGGGGDGAAPHPFAGLPSLQAHAMFDDGGGGAAGAAVQQVRRKKAVRRARAGTGKQGQPLASHNAAAIAELAAMFCDMEVAVSSLELLHELRKGTPIAATNRGSVGGGVAAKVAIAKQQPGRASMVAVAADLDLRQQQQPQPQVGSSSVKYAARPLPETATDVARQLTRWRDLCDTALLVQE
ncbi:hypothetical protein FOA52_011278 [Chlamydomonas sp. UWO 241]|nr:hypothetical protein FOA52_011278 [Chlamydomonas sp. UWO 241]